MLILIPLIAAIAPFILWPVELLLPFPYIIEEITKALLLVAILNAQNKAVRIKVTLITAIIFSFSESVFYFFNISLVGNLTILLNRLLLTTLLHSLTMLIILLSGYRKRRFMVVGLVLAMLVHYLFNRLL